MNSILVSDIFMQYCIKIKIKVFVVVTMKFFHFFYSKMKQKLHYPYLFIIFTLILTVIYLGFSGKEQIVPTEEATTEEETTTEEVTTEMTTASESSVETSPKMMFTIFLYLVVCVNCISWISFGAGRLRQPVEDAIVYIEIFTAYAATIVGIISLIIESLTKHEIILTCIFLTGIVIFSGSVVYKIVKELQGQK